MDHGTRSFTSGFVQIAVAKIVALVNTKNIGTSRFGGWGLQRMGNIWQLYEKIKEDKTQRGIGMKRKFCLSCFLELQNAGKHDIRRVGGGRNMKIICWRCKCRRFGAEYEISRKGNQQKMGGKEDGERNAPD